MSRSPPVEGHGATAAPEPRLELPEDPFDGSRILLRSAAVLLVGIALLVLLHLRGLEERLAADLARSDLEGKVDLYSKEARRMLEGSRLAEYLEQNPDGLVRLERLLGEAGQAEDPAAYLHVKEDGRETLLFKGPDLVQQITMTPGRVELLEGDGQTVRRMVVQEGEEPPRLVDVQQPLEKVLDRKILNQAFVSPQRRFADRIQRSREALRARLLGYSIAGLLLVTLVFAAVSYQFGRIRHLEQQMRRQRQLAYLGTLAGGLAHEIRNPLNGITLNLHLLEETLGGADERLKAQSSRFLGRIKPALSHLERIVTEFLDFARPRPLDLAPVSVSELARQVAEFLEPDARARGVRVVVRAEDPAGESVIPGDRERLRQVFLNLVANAFQAAPQGGTVEVEVEGGPRQVTVRIRDDGPGVPVGHEEEIFRLFFTTRAGGVGLGLPIVRRVVEDHRGEIVLERGEGTGACFRVRLPRER